MNVKDRIREAAAQVQTVPGWSLSDRSFHSSFANNQERVSQFQKVNQAVKSYYLNQGHSAEQFQALSPQQFNRVWRQLLGLSLDDAPPPRSMRHVLP